ncbi:hypothetical protein EVAR_41854_1 [Eumeta japonica]|uniref:Uncharacterized protein n=1 Tax=Eumeta variegata TaxID=151549 RepID=A0A4C1XCJ5_EUMVA|nr:hypothetical protein EVAR_41854_1 [Eumeta japonica]
MSIKLHYLRNHLDKFPDNLGNYSEEQGERFHQDLKVIEERYQEIQGKKIPDPPLAWSIKYFVLGFFIVLCNWPIKVSERARVRYVTTRRVRPHRHTGHSAGLLRVVTR